MSLAVFAMLAMPLTVQAEDIYDSFSEKLDRAADKDDFVGFAVAVVDGGDIALIRTYGQRQVSSAAPVTPDTVFRIASLSKGFAATLAGLAVRDGKLHWDDPVAEAVPQFHLMHPKETRSVTVEHILSHRVGLPPYAYDNLLEADVAPQTILSRYRNVDLICPVGSCYSYQNNAFNMIQIVLERAEGAPYDRLVKSRIFEPLDMRTASIGRDGLVHSDDWARPHVRYRKNPWRVIDVDDAYYHVPAAGGVNASITDMALWLRAQMGDAPEEVLPHEVIELVHRPVIETRAETRRQRTLRARLKKTYYGLGWRIYDYAGHQVINHSGGVDGYLAQIAFLPEKDVGIVILTNTQARRTGRILPTFLDLQLGIADRDWLMLDEEAAP